MSLGFLFGSLRDLMVQKVEQIIREEYILVVIVVGNEFVVIDSLGIVIGVIIVVVVDRNMKVVFFLGKGLGLNIYDIKFDIVVLGVKILSVKVGMRNEFIVMSGIFMVIFYVSGVVVLILQKYGDFIFEMIKFIFEKMVYLFDGIDVLLMWLGVGVVDVYVVVKVELSESGGFIDFFRRLFG